MVKEVQVTKEVENPALQREVERLQQELGKANQWVQQYHQQHNQLLIMQRGEEQRLAGQVPNQ